MRLPSIASLALCMVACSSSGPGGRPDNATPQATVQMTVTNRSEVSVSVFAVWATTRTRLGQVGVGSTRDFSTPYLGPDVALGVDLASVPPAGTSAGPAYFDPRTVERGSDMLRTAAYPVDDGDILVFEIRRVSPRLDVFFRELLP